MTASANDATKSLPAGKRRSCAKLVRFSPAELQVVCTRARAAGRPVACYIREASLGPAPRVRRAELNDSLIRGLARLASELTVIIAEAKRHGLDVREFERSACDMLDLIRQLD